MKSKEKYLKLKSGEYDEIRDRRKEILKLPKELQDVEIRKAEHEAHLLNAETFWQKIESETNPDYKRRLALALDVIETINVSGGLALVVGGYARDEVLRKLGYEVRPKDIDIEVYGLDFGSLRKILEDRFGKDYGVSDVGTQFRVIKFENLFDLSIPRRDSKIGKGHKGFEVVGDPNMTVKEAARRRDFAMNSLALDPLTGQIIDEWGGIDDILHKRLRATDPELFKDDPLRVFRAMQFAARFGFTIEPQTLEICRSIDTKELPDERIAEEWQKLIEKSPKPSIGLEAARELGLIERHYPELKALVGCGQDPEWHPEGDVWVHTAMAMDAAAELARREKLDEVTRKVIILGALCHDLGKPETTKFEDGRIRSKGHEEAGKEPAESFLKNILKSVADGDLILRKIVPIIGDHLFHVHNPEPTARALNRLAKRIYPATIQELMWVAECDHRGRALEWKGFPEAEEILRRAEELKIKEKKPESLLLGRDLIKLGFSPGPKFGQILGAVYEAQLDGLVQNRDEALDFVKKFL